MPNSFFALLSVFSTLFLCGLGIYGLSFRHTPAARPFSVSMFVCAFWSWSAACEIFSQDLEGKIFWSNMRYMAITFAPLIALILVLSLTERTHLINDIRLVSLLVIPVITTIIVWTQPYHTLFRYSYRIESSGLSPFLASSTGPWYWVHVSYIYILQVFIFVLLIASLHNAGPLYYRQILTVAFSLFIPPALNFLVFFFDKDNLISRNYHFTPIVTGLLMAWAILRYRMFDLMPIARSTVIENMSDLMLVLDTRNCLVDFNPAAQEVFGLGKIHSGGIPVTTLLEQGLDFLQHCKNERERGEFTIGSAEHCRVYDVTFIPINARKKYFVGWMILMRDITTRKQAEDELRSAYTCLQTQLTEVEKLQIQLREQAIRDPLTGLFNRRYLEETLERELARAFRQQTLFTIIMLDIDHFKKVNDLYGHKAGDLILKNLGEYLLSHTRTEDIACRYGGEEFVLILPGMSLESAYQRAEQFRISFQAFRVKYNENEFGVTLSLGIAAYPEHSTSVEELVAMADLALYAAKAGGRNRTIIYKSTLVGA